MKTITCALIIAASLTLGLTNLQSQAPAAPPLPAVPKTSAEALLAAKATNQKLLERQAATLLKLEELEKNSQQLRLFAARN